MSERPSTRAEAMQAQILTSQHEPLLQAPIAEGDSRKRQYESLISGFCRTGGVVTGNKLAALVAPHSQQAVSKVARWIVSRRALSFSWEGQTLLPLFQFEGRGMQLSEGMATVLPELVDVFDNWELAQWFANPSPWLGGVAPADLMTTRPDLVHDAARVDRFIARR